MKPNRLCPQSRDRVHRVGTGLNTSQRIAPTGEISGPQHHDPGTHAVPHHHREKLPEASWAHGSLYIRGTTCQTQASSASVMACVSAQTCQAQLGQDRDPASPYPRLAPVVDGHSAGVLRSSLRCPTAIPSAGDERIRFRLGSSSGGTQDSEPLVADRSPSSYQCQGGQNGAPSVSVIPPLSNRSMCIGHYGQYDWDDLYQQMGVHAPLPCARKPSGYGTFV